MLPLLYSIHDLSSATEGDVVVAENRKLALLWRSIIASSVGGTFYPYCLWIKVLNLGSLHSLIEDLARDQMKTWFFSAPLKEFYVTSTSRAKRPVMNIEAIVTKVATQVTSFIKKSAEDENKTVMLSGLEGYHLPTSILPDLVSKLSQLSSLTVRDGSVLTADVSRSIRDSCPFFKEVVCHYCMGTDVDQDLAGFFSGLTPNTLESFTITSANAIDEQTFRALGGHSASLKELSLSLELPAVAALRLLGGCQNLRRLSIEALSLARISNWHADLKEELLDITSWLKSCTLLTRVDAVCFPTASMLSEVLKAPNIRLSSLSARLIDMDDQLYNSLSHQTELESLSFHVTDEAVDLVPATHDLFVSSICSCAKLRKLDVMSEVLNLQDILRIKECLPLLDDLSFDGEVDDDYLPPLARIRYLKNLNINASSTFTFAGLLNFISDLQDADADADHEGIRIFIMRQLGEYKFSEQEETMLSSELWRKMGGLIQLAYEGDPDELHESDLSD